MANRIKGIIVEIGGDTVGLQKALKDVNDKAKNVSSEMREVEKALKLDPTNTELLAQKQQLLSKQTEIAKEKLSALKEVQKQVEEQFKNGQIGEEQYRAFQREVAVAEGNVKKLDGQLDELDKAMNTTSDSAEELSKDLDNAGKTTKDLGENVEQSESKLAKFGEAAKKVGQFALQAFKEMAGQAVDFCKSAVSVGQEFDSSMSQVAATLGMTTDAIKNNVNGAGDTFDMLREKAKEMGSSTNFSASQAADGLNTLAMSGYSAKESVEMIEDVLHLSAAGSIDMANAAGYISGAMKGFNDRTKTSAYYADLMAKGATLANTSVAQLGEAMSSGAAGAAAYSQTADSMTVALLRLAEQGDVGSAAGTALAAAMKDLYTPSDKAKKALAELGISAYDTNGKARDFNTVVNELNNSLSKYTEEQQNAYKQSIFGQQGLNAYNKMVVTAIDKQNEWTQALANCSGEAANQYATMTDNLQGDIDSWNSALDGFKIELSDKLMPTVREFVQFGTESLSSITKAFQENGFDGVMDALSDSLNNGITMITQKLPQFLSVAKTIVLALVKGIANNLPEIVKAALELVTSLVTGLLDSLPELLPAAVGIVQAVADTITKPDTLTQILDAALQLLIAMSDGLIDAIPQLVDAAIQIIENLIRFLVEPQNISKLVNAGIRVTMALQTGLLNALPKLAEGALKLVLAIGDTIVHTDWLQVGKNIVDGLWNGLQRSWGSLQDWFFNAVSGLVDGIKGWLGIHSPSKVFAGIGDFMALGLGEGFTKSMTAVNKDIANAIPTDFDIEPTINGSAPQKAFNGNTQTESKIVFMMNIENFYNQNKQDLDEIMEYAGDYFSAQMERRSVMF